MQKMNKSELKTNETLITRVTYALFYKVDKNRLQLVGVGILPVENKTKSSSAV